MDENRKQKIMFNIGTTGIKNKSVSLFPKDANNQVLILDMMEDYDFKTVPISAEILFTKHRIMKKQPVLETKKEIPMLFSTDMVKALIGDIKTETRRTRNLDVINENPDNYKLLWSASIDGPVPSFRDKKTLADIFIKCPYGKKGDKIWVRETFTDGYNSTLDGNIGKEEKDWTQRYWVFKDGGQKFNTGEIFQGHQAAKFVKGIKWTPSIHMPKKAARIWLEITDITIERLKDITKESAIAEGIEGVDKIKSFKTPIEVCRMYKSYQKKSDELFKDPTTAYMTLWEKINGIGSWNKNPYVWCVKFKVIKK